MRLVLAIVLAGLVALPLSAGAQDGDESAPGEPSAEEPAPSSEPAPQEPALELKLDNARVEVVPSPPPTFDGYTLDELELRKRRAALGLIAPAVVTAAGVALLVLGTSGDCYNDWLDDWDDRDACRRPRVAGAVLTSVGGAGMIVGSGLAIRSARELRSAQGYTLEQMQLRRKRAKIGLGVSAGVAGAGMAMALVAGLVTLAQWGNDKPFDRAEAALTAALAISLTGIIGMVTAGGILVHRKRKARKFEHHETPRRVQWDVARSALVF